MNPEQKIVKEDILEIVEAVGEEFKKLSGRTLLITGPNGLLASYLVDTVAFLNKEKILKDPCRVLGLYRSDLKKGDRVFHLLADPHINLIQHDVTQPCRFDEPIDYIVHAAGRSAPAIFQAEPLATVDVNIKGVRWLLDLAIEKQVRSFLYFSSGEIYGSPPPEHIPTPETYKGNVSPLGSRACYSEAKRLAETLCSIYYRKNKVPVKIVRPFIVYGPGLELKDRRVMADFIRSGINHKPTEMLSEGLDTRSYCYISDATTAFWRILFSDQNGEAFNVASDKEEISIRDLAELVHELCGINVPVKGPGAESEKEIGFLKEAPKRVCPDITKIRKLFGYEPKVAIKEGLKRTINWNLAKLGGGVERKDSNPLISVVMPAYNAERYLAEAIDSILSQTFRDFELLLVDDCSTDTTLEIIDEYARRDDRISVFRNDKNLKLARTLNRGIKAARGKYIARMDADDVSFPYRFGKQVKFMEENPEVGILGGTMVVTGKDSRVINERRYYTRDEEIRKNIFKFSPFCHPAIMIRKAVLEKSGLYDPYYNPVEDYELYFRIGLHAKFANLEDSLLRYRIAADSMTTGGLKEMELKTVDVREKFFDSEVYKATATDKIYNLTHLISILVPVIPPKQKIRLFTKVRSYVVKSKALKI